MSKARLVVCVAGGLHGIAGGAVSVPPRALGYLSNHEIDAALCCAS